MFSFFKNLNREKIQQACKDGVADGLNKMKDVCGTIKEKLDYSLTLFNAPRTEDEKLSFEEANKLTLELIEGNARQGESENDRRVRQINESVTTIATVVREIYDYFSVHADLADDELMEKLSDINEANLDIARRMTDKNFYVGIVGEFSCGKSTFINAMLEQRFLIEDVLQGTTCSKTTIKYAPEEDITVIFNNDKYVKMRKKTDKEILLDGEQKREFLRMMTADESRAKNIREVIWESPIEVLNNGLCIVDTPGIGSLNPRHTEVAKAASLSCDALLVLTNLEKALSQELTEAVTEIAGPQAGNCLFIGTRMDQLREKELPRMKKHFQKRLKSQYGHDCQFEFVSAYVALEELEGKREEKGGLAEFREFRSKIKELLESNRQVSQSRKAADLVAKMSRDVSSAFEPQKDDFDKKIKQYQKEIVDEDARKWSSWKNETSQSFSLGSKGVKADASDAAIHLVDRIRAKVKSRINSCNDTSELKEYLKSGISGTIESFSEEIQQSPQNFLQEPLTALAESCQKKYSEHFEREYRKIEAIFGSSMQFALTHDKTVNMVVNTRAGQGDFMRLSEDIDSEENYKIGGGLATGIGISLLVPGVGWVIGGALTLLGGIFGAGLLKSLDTRKSEACDKVDESMKQFERKLRDTLNSNYNALQKEFEARLNKYMDAQKKSYQKVIKSYNEDLAQKTRLLDEAKSFLDAKLARLKGIAREMRTITQQEYFLFDERNCEDVK